MRSGLGLEAQFERFTIKQMPHPVHIMPGIISLSSHVSMTESVDVIERYQINFAWQQTGSPVHSRDSGIDTASCKLAQTMDVFLGLIENGLTECAHIAQEM